MANSIDQVRAKKRKPLRRQALTMSSALHAQTVKVVNAVYLGWGFF